MIIIKERYVEIEIQDGSDINISRDIVIPLDIYHSPISKDIASRLGKMRIQDIARDLNISIPIVKKHRKEILSKLSEIQKATIICQEQKIEKLRKKILAGEIKRRPHNYSFGVEGLVRGIVRDLTIQGKSIREIEEQTHIETSTISYHRKKIKDGEIRKYPPRIMNMQPNKKIKVKKLLKENKRQTDICNILDISSATASIIVNKIKKDNIKNDTNKNDTNKNDTNKNDTNKNDTNKNDTNKNDTNKNDTNKNDTNKN